MDELSFNFFKLFSRFEYSLKAASVFKVSGRDNVNADWTLFAQSIDKLFNEMLLRDDELKAATEYLQNSPPKK